MRKILNKLTSPKTKRIKWNKNSCTIIWILKTSVKYLVWTSTKWGSSSILSLTLKRNPWKSPYVWQMRPMKQNQYIYFNQLRPSCRLKQFQNLVITSKNLFQRTLKIIWIKTSNLLSEGIVHVKIRLKGVSTLWLLEWPVQVKLLW